jgi:hypothetical protein
MPYLAEQMNSSSGWSPAKTMDTEDDTYAPTALNHGIPVRVTYRRLSFLYSCFIILVLIITNISYECGTMCYSF